MLALVSPLPAALVSNYYCWGAGAFAYQSGCGRWINLKVVGVRVCVRSCYRNRKPGHGTKMAACIVAGHFAVGGGSLLYVIFIPVRAAPLS